MIPRLTKFKSTKYNLTHLALVNGDDIKLFCVRMPIKYGSLVDPESKITCGSCQSGGWMKTIGYFGREPVKDTNGRLLAWEDIPADMSDVQSK